MDAIYMTFEIDGLPYEIKAVPCLYNNEIQYLVSLNGGEDVIFVFDSDLGRYSAQGNNAIDIPDYVDIEMGNHLNKDSKMRMK